MSQDEKKITEENPVPEAEAVTEEQADPAKQAVGSAELDAETEAEIETEIEADVSDSETQPDEIKEPKNFRRFSGSFHLLKGKNPFSSLERNETPQRKRLRQIFEVFSSHNFFVDGLKPASLRMLLEDLGPTFVKIGQIMSSRPDILPKEYCEELKKLRSEVKPLEVSVVKEQILKEFGKPVEELFLSFGETPLGSASIAQVHAATLPDGRKVVAKVQRPNVAENMRMDLSIMKRLADLASEISTGGGIAIKDVILELEKVTEDEIDFRVEAENTRQFRQLCTDPEEDVDCPEIIDALSGEHVMTMTFASGYSIGEKDRIIADGLDPDEIGQRLVNNYLDQIMDAGLFHGDPHQGNIFVDKGRITWLDMGMMGRLSESERQQITGLLLSVTTQDLDELKAVILDLGKQIGPIDHIKLTEDLDGFIRRYGRTALESLDLGAVVEEIMDLAKKHNIELPGWISVLARGLMTIEGVVADLCPNLNVLGLLTDKVKSQIRKNFHLLHETKEAMTSMAEAAKKSIRIPALAADALHNLNRGHTKVNVELSYDGLTERVEDLVKKAILAVFACTLLLASSLICMTDMSPKILGIPAIGLLGFVIAIALGIYVIIKMSQRGDEKK